MPVSAFLSPVPQGRLILAHGAAVGIGCRENMRPEGTLHRQAHRNQAIRFHQTCCHFPEIGCRSMRRPFGTLVTRENHHP